MMFRNKLMTCLLTFCFVWGFAGAPGASAAEKKKVEMQSSAFGGTLYQLAFAFSEIVKKHSDILEINPVESAGTGAGIMKVYGDPKGRVTAGTPITIIAAKNGDKPFDKPYPDMRAIGNFVRNAQVLITLRGDIKKVTDLAGRKVGLGPQPTVLGRSMRDVIEIGYGLKGKVKIFYMRWPQLKDSLVDGSIDAMVLGISMGPGGKWFPVPVYQEITASGKIPTYLGYTKEALEKAEKGANSSFPPVMVKKDGVAKGQPQEDIISFSDDLGVWVHKDFDPALAYEMARVLNEHWEEMRGITGMARATFKEIINDLAVSDDMIHPGALKYMKEKGLR
ncbi:MAG: TAXI family TRAP transporter solute-binding subunit [Pseudomonadota bacterium]